jgi:hypothetical protein
MPVSEVLFREMDKASKFGLSLATDNRGKE